MATDIIKTDIHAYEHEPYDAENFLSKDLRTKIANRQVVPGALSVTGKEPIKPNRASTRFVLRNLKQR